jgi:hypothetical protein
LIGRESNISSKSTNKRYHQQHAEESKAKQSKADFLMNRQQVRNTHTGGKTEQTIKGANQGFKEREKRRRVREGRRRPTTYKHLGPPLSLATKN